MESVNRRGKTEEPTAADLDASFPSTRIDYTRLRATSLVWAVYLPLGCFVALSRLACCFLLTAWAKLRGQDANLASNNYTLINGLRSKVHFHTSEGKSTTAGWEQLYGAGTPPGAKRLVFALEHHSLIDSAFLCHAPQPLCTIANAKVGSGVMGMLTASNKNTLYKRRDQPLREIMQLWSANPGGGLCIFPQATTCAQSIMVPFMPRTFELLNAEDEVHPVVVDYHCPLPIHLRTTESGFAWDLFWMMLVPVTRVTFTVLPAVPPLSPEQAAKHCQEQILGHAQTPRRMVNVTCFDKLPWRALVAASLQPGYRVTETKLLKLIQSVPYMLPVALALHFVIQESVLIAAAAILVFGGWQQQSILYLARAICTLLLVCTIIKQVLVKPRPAWLKSPQLINPYKLRFPVHQYDYTFPSGHSAFVACLWLSYFFMSQQPGKEFHFHWWLHLLLAVLAVFTGLSRMYLSLHWCRDVVCGWAFGAFWSWVWCKKLEMHYSAADAWVQVVSSILVALALAACSGYLTFKLANEANIIAWSEVVGHPLQTHSPKYFLLQLAMFCAVFTGAPQARWIYPHVPLPYCTDPPAWLRACFVLIGFAVLAAMWAVLLWFLPKQLRGATFRKLDVEEPEPSQGQKMDMMLTAASARLEDVHVAPDNAATAAVKYTFSGGNARNASLLYFFSVVLMLEWILIGSQVIYSKMEERVCGPRVY